MSVVCPIPKKQTSTTIDSFCLIALTEMFRCMFEKCLLHAFERSFSLFQSHALYSHELCAWHDLYWVFVDFKDAYNTAPMHKVLDALQQHNTPPGVLLLIMSLFMNDGSKIAVNDELSCFVPKEYGLFQGFILLPLLFDIFINDAALALMFAFPVNEIRYHTALFFADNIKIQHKDSLEP
ncbi:hypothetical protein DSO57_1027545 [Entomophthora muscae]|uniref:Uncharacterized protein n=1 Tax=Entomophthora muscae TaxID=34485 RepID=A0ACC2RSN0_9FUNG|nr:hypothetical protein DSO57_1027545 [Entomophthora muscae]